MADESTSEHQIDTLPASKTVAESSGLTRRESLKLAAASALAVALGGKSEEKFHKKDTYPKPYPKEAFRDRDYGLNFQPGRHGNDKAEENVTKNRNFDSFKWNVEVLERIQDIDIPPKLLTIDSMRTSISYEVSPDNKDKVSAHIDRVGMWAWLPGKPSDINPDGRVYVVSTEQAIHQSESFFREGENEELRKALEEKFAKDYKGPLEQKDVEAGYAAAILAGALTLIGEEPTRRRVLKAGIVAGAVALASFGKGRSRIKLAREAGYVDSETKKDKRMKLVDTLAPGSLVHKDWLDARNAMYILKTKDSMDALVKSGAMTHEDSAVILAGYKHAFGMSELMESDDACVAAIQKYAEGLFSIVDQFAEKDPSIKADQVKENIVRMMSAANIYEVKDAFPDETVERSLQKAIKHKGGGISQRVYDGLSGVLPGLAKTGESITINAILEPDLPPSTELQKQTPVLSGSKPDSRVLDHA